MAKLSKKAIAQLCDRLDVDRHFFAVCLEESIIEVTEIKGRLDFQNGTLLRLRRLERIVMTFHVEPEVALLFAHSVLKKN